MFTRAASHLHTSWERCWGHRGLKRRWSGRRWWCCAAVSAGHTPRCELWPGCTSPVCNTPETHKDTHSHHIRTFLNAGVNALKMDWMHQDVNRRFWMSQLIVDDSAINAIQVILKCVHVNKVQPLSAFEFLQTLWGRSRVYLHTERTGDWDLITHGQSGHTLTYVFNDWLFSKSTDSVAENLAPQLKLLFVLLVISIQFKDFKDFTFKEHEAVNIYLGKTS